MASSPARYPRLFSPLEVGGLRLANRLVMTPLYTGYAREDGHASPLLLEHYRQMGASGLALVVVESCAVDPSGVGSPRMLRAYDDAFLGDLARIASEIHAGGALACCQINHVGRFAFVEEPLAPSPVPVFGRTPKALEIEQIESVVEAYADAALRVQRAGFDLVELHGGTGYLLTSFLSPRTNLREDAYGGSPEARMRFPLEVVAATRRAVGTDYPVGYRFEADEWLPDGLHPGEAIPFAGALEQAGIAYLSVMGGTYESFFLPEVLELSARDGYMVDLAAGVRGAVSVPVVAAGRISNPDLAERVLEAGQADLIGLARVILADPDWVQKALTGREDEIEHCRTDCDACTSQVMSGQSVACSTWSVEKIEYVRAMSQE
ncbi:MAG: NADH:flavin oxidoreductase [bacterium]